MLTLSDDEQVVLAVDERADRCGLSPDDLRVLRSAAALIRRSRRRGDDLNAVELTHVAAAAKLARSAFQHGAVSTQETRA
jgi:hypothetical protein